MFWKAILKSVVFISMCGASSVFGRERILDERQGEIPAADVQLVRVDAGAGWLKVIGQAENGSVRFEAEFIGDARNEKSAADMLDQMRLEHRTKGGTLGIVARVDDSGWGRSGRINLTLYVPDYVDMEISDSSGSMTVRDIGGSLSIDDSSGSIEVEGVGRDLRIEDSSGGIDVRDIGGSADIDDSSGSIHVRGVGGSVIVSDSAGSINVRDVDGDFEVTRDGSGGIDFDQVRGRVTLPRNKRRD